MPTTRRPGHDDCPTCDCGKYGDHCRHEHDPWGLTDTEIAVLEMERGWWKFAGAKEQAVRDRFGWTTTRYYLVVGELLERPEAMAWDAGLVRRLQRVRERRAAARTSSPSA